MIWVLLLFLWLDSLFFFSSWLMNIWIRISFLLFLDILFFWFGCFVLNFSFLLMLVVELLVIRVVLFFEMVFFIFVSNWFVFLDIFDLIVCNRFCSICWVVLFNCFFVSLFNVCRSFVFCLFWFLGFVFS